MTVDAREVRETLEELIPKVRKLEQALEAEIEAGEERVLEVETGSHAGKDRLSGAEDDVRRLEAAREVLGYAVENLQEASDLLA